MKLKEINNYEDLKKYCNCSINYVETLPQTPNATTIFPIEYYGQNNSGSIKYYEFPTSIKGVYATMNGIKGFIFSYDTPIGVLKNNKLYILKKTNITLSHTTDTILREFNKKFPTIDVIALYHISSMFDIDSDYLEEFRRSDYIYD